MLVLVHRSFCTSRTMYRVGESLKSHLSHFFAEALAVEELS